MLKSKCAVYLPALSDAYLRYVPGSSFPRSAPISPDDLNFLDPNNRLFYYPYALTSAGQTNGVISQHNSMLDLRNKAKTTVVADSGGFQIQSGQIPFHGTATAQKMLTWMEDVGDYSMILDFPTGGISAGNMTLHYHRLVREGHGPTLAGMNAQNQLGDEFNACLLQTIINNNDFIQYRDSGKTRLLNVLQGRNEAESKVWYDAVKHFPFEDWSFAGQHQSSFTILLNRIFDMIHDGKLENVEWIHVLGTSKPFAGAILTTLQRCLRRYVNPDIQISFDSASPFRNAAFNGIYLGALLDKTGWSFATMALPDIDPALRNLPLKDFIDVALPDEERENSWGWFDETLNIVRAHTGISKQITAADILQNAKGGADSVGTALLMNHNTQAMIDAFEHINQMVFSDEAVPQNMPKDIWSCMYAVEMLFDKHFHQPHQFIHDYAGVLDRFAHL